MKGKPRLREAHPRHSRPALELIRVLRPYTRPYRRYAVVIFICLVVGLPLAWITPHIVKRVFDVDVPAKDLSAILVAGALMAAITYAEAVLSLIRGACTTLFHSKALHRLRLDLFRGYQALRVGFVQSKETGEMVSLLSDDVGNLSGVLADRLATAVDAGVRFLVVGAILIALEWRLAGIAVAGALLVVFVNVLFNRPLRRRSREVRERMQDLDVEQHQALTGNQLVRSTASESFEFRRYAEALGSATRAIVKRDFFGLWTGHPSVVVGGIVPGIVLLFGAAFIAEGSMTQGDLFAMFMYLGQFFGAALTLGRLNPGFQASLASLDRIADLLEAEKTERQPTGRRVIESLVGDVRYEDVRFGYGRPGEVPEVLHGISLHAPRGATIAVVGKSGAGKSTLLSLIPRFFEPWSGRILIDGVPLVELDTRWLRRQIGIVPQDVFLFDRTIGENIAYGKPGATQGEIEAAAQAAHALGFIREMPDGFSTRIGERGVKLSAGQRQRLAIAREILRSPRILILDEATSSLDSETEREVHAALTRLLEDRTAFVIAHRLSTVRNANTILVLDAGSLVATGTHDTLVRDCAIYRELALLQSLTPDQNVEAAR